MKDIKIAMFALSKQAKNTENQSDQGHESTKSLDGLTAGVRLVARLVVRLLTDGLLTTLDSALNSEQTSRIGFPSSVKLSIYVKLRPQGIAELDIGHLTSSIEEMRPPRRVIQMLAEWRPNSSASLAI